jgi:tetratricopeptide (TPR) repeat protein
MKNVQLVQTNSLSPMKGIIQFIIFVFFGIHCQAQTRLDLVKEKVAEGEYELIIKGLTPILDQPECEPNDFAYLIFAYMMSGDCKNALVYSDKWLNRSLEKNDTLSVLKALSYKTQCYGILKETEKGIESAHLSHKYCTEKDSIRITATNLRLGLLYYYNGEYDKAYDTYRRINYDIIVEDRRQGEYFTNFAIIYSEIGNLDSSIYFKQQALNLNRGSENVYDQSLRHSNIAASYFDLGELETALIHLDSTRIPGLDTNHPNYQLIYQNYYTVYSNLNEVDSAFVYLDKLKNLNNFLNQQSMEIELQELKSSYEREAHLKTKMVKTSRDLEKSRDQLLVWIIVVLLIFITAGSIILYMRFKNVKSSRDNLLVTQRLLRSQMTPHFIFNSLSVLQGMILSKEDKNAVLYLSKFSKLLRTILENSRYKTVALSDELAAIDNYITLENFGVKTPYNYQLEMDDGIESTAIRIPPMLIQPFIENAIKHAFVGETEGYEIKVGVTFNAKRLICTIADNGIGINSSTKNNNQNKTSLATAITTERLAMLAKDFKMKGSAVIQDRAVHGEKGTLVTLVIPYKLEK